MAHNRRPYRRAGAAVAAGSEKFAWLLFPGVRRRCRQCGKEPLKIADVGEHRTIYPSNKTEFLCKVCQREKVETAIEENRRALRLQEWTPPPIC